MTKTLLLAFAILLSAAWLQAQTQSSQSSTDQSGSSASSSSAAGQTTVQGCLEGSSGSYTLTSDSGTKYQLSGDTSKLDKHVGHEVAVTGSTSGSSSATPSSGSSASTTSNSSSSGSSLSVDSVKHIAATCSNASK